MIKTRFAPSPTGKLHVGNVRTALFAYLYAKHTDGHFILRIEDTDQERSLSEYTVQLMEDLKWLGIDWDEGPLLENPDQEIGDNGPYHQSRRGDIYMKYAEQLIEEGRAYYCYCTHEELEERKKALQEAGKPPHYDRKCMNLTPEQIEQYKKEGREPVIRFRVYDDDLVLNDIVKGEVKFPKNMVGDFVIVRGNGVPVYNYAVVVDDATMEVTHVLRADEHLSNTVRQLMIYRALGWNPPQFAHMSLVMGTDGKKLSKRHGATSVSEFRAMGYLPEALMNYLAMLGWSSPTGEEMLDQAKLVEQFDLDRLSSSPAIFDMKKLDWISKHYVINADIDRIYELALPYIKETGFVTDDYLSEPENVKFLKGVVELTRGYCACLSQIKDHIEYFINDDYTIDPEAMKFLEKDDAGQVLTTFADAIRNESKTVDEESFTRMIEKIMQDTGIKGKKLFMPIRAALTGRTSGPEVYFLIPVIGNERTLARIERVLKMLA